MIPKEQRGYLNNNPGNMDRDPEAWEGEIKDSADPRLTPFQRHELTDGRFCVFVDAQHGIRAMAKNLFAYHDELKLRSVAALIGEWAPPNENDTTAYIKAVCERLGVQADDPVDVRNRTTLHALIDAIIRVECGGMPYGREIDDGLALAGVRS
jgi:hypothetical protein